MRREVLNAKIPNIGVLRCSGQHLAPVPPTAKERRPQPLTERTPRLYEPVKSYHD